MEEAIAKIYAGIYQIHMENIIILTKLATTKEELQTISDIDKQFKKSWGISDEEGR